tara:strand:+ start:7463 stop:7981 length:519 start_codon:yes stop_codon:yes gene_type:complete
MDRGYSDRKLLELTIVAQINARVPPGQINIPPELEDLVELDPDIGVPRPRVISVVDLQMEAMENLMAAMAAWSDYLRTVAGIFERESKQVSAAMEEREFDIFMRCEGSIELRKKQAKHHPDVKALSFDLRVLDGAAHRLNDATHGLDNYVGVLKYALRSALKFRDSSGNVYR